MADRSTSPPTNDNAARLRLRRRSRARAVVFLTVVGLSVITALFAGRYTVIQTETEILAAGTDHFDFTRVYVNVRGWAEADYLADPQTTRTLILRGYEHLRQYEASPPPAIEPEGGPATPARRPAEPAEEPVEPVSRRLDRIFKKTDK